MASRMTVVCLWLLYFATIDADLFSMEKLRDYAKYLDWNGVKMNSSDNELWDGLIHDCSKRMTFSCIQKNAYAYLDNTFVDRDNITLFDGFVLWRNDLDYETMSKRSRLGNDIAENMVEASANEEPLKSSNEDDEGRENRAKAKTDSDKTESSEYETPLEEITGALRDKAIKFLLTRDYELQLPHLFFEDSTVKVSPRAFDEKGALIRVEFGQRGLGTQGRLFKKIKKFIQNKLLVSFFALILIIKLIKIKFLFVIPFLFGIGAAKKLFLKLLLFLVPAFAHVFKLCSSYYSSYGHHHHHHQIAHHHHHVPVPVPVPTYYSPNHHHSHNLEEHEGYEYSHPHIQLRKDIEELKEWGIKPMDDPYDNHEDGFGIHTIRGQVPLSPVYQANSFAVPQQSSVPRPAGAPSYQPKYPGRIPAHAQSLAYNGYIDEHPKFNRRISAQSPVTATTITHVSQVPPSPMNIQLPALSSANAVASNVPMPAGNSNPNTPYTVYPQQLKINVPQQAIAQPVAKPAQSTLNQKTIAQSQTLGHSGSSAGSALAHSSNNYVAYDDPFYGPILERLDDIFAQLRFTDENCRERLLCSMYKNPAQYSPHSNLVSNELSRDPEELKRGDTGSDSSRRFYRYVSAARLGQDNGDCLRTHPCQINTE